MKKQLGPYKIEEFYWKQQQEKSIVENIRIQGSSVSNKCSYSKKFRTRNWMNDIVKIVKSLEKLLLLINVVTGIFKNKAKKQKVEFLTCILSTLAASLLKNMLSSKIVEESGAGVIGADEGVIRTGEGILNTKSPFS